MTVAFICGVVLLFALVLVCEEQTGSDEPLRPASLLRWLMAGNWTAKLGGLLLSIGSGALLRYLMLHLDLPPSARILCGVLIAAAFGVGGALLAGQPRRRAISLALNGASLAVAYLTAYSAYEFFHFVADVQALGLLFLVAGAATGVAITRRALSIAVLGMAGAYLAPAFALTAAGPIPVYGYYAGASLVTALMVWVRGWRPLIHLSFLFTLAGALFFGWTREFYTPAHYSQMQPLLLLLVAIHLSLPLLESGAGSAASARLWARRFDQAYFIALPLVAAVLTLVLAPTLHHEGALGLAALGILWAIAALVEKLRAAADSLHYLAVALAFLLLAGLVAATQVPVFLIAAVLMCAAISAGGRLKLTPGATFLAIGTALATSACYVLQSLFAPVSGTALLNAPFADHLLLGVALLAAWHALRRREHSLAPIFAIFGGTWLCLALARELFRLHFDHIAELSYLAALLATGSCVALVRMRALACMAAVALCGVALLIAGFAGAGRFSADYVLPLMLAGQILYSLLGLACDRNGDEEENAGAIARGTLPVLLLPWAITLSGIWSGNADTILTLLVASALLASLQGQWFSDRRGAWPTRLSPLGFVLFGVALLYEALCHIERNPWAVAFELLGLVYLVETAHFLWSRKVRDAAVFGYLSMVAAASICAAMLLRLIGPPGTLTILDLNHMVLPAFVSLSWAAIGGFLTWLSRRRGSRILWSLGALLMVAAALKLILLDFGSLGQIANILAMMAAGGLFLLVAWIAPFPPKATEEQRPSLEPRPVRDTHGGIWWTIGLLGLVAFGYWHWTRRSISMTPPTPAPAATAQIPALCQRFADRLPADYLVYAAGDGSSATSFQPGTPDSAQRQSVAVRINGADQNIVLALSANGLTTWRLRPADSARVVGVILAGMNPSTIVGVSPNVPVLHAAFGDAAPCGYFQIDSDAPQGADQFVSRLLVHAVDGTYRPDGRSLVLGPEVPQSPSTAAPVPPQVQIGAATYSSQRNGRSLELTGILKSQCEGNPGGCTVRCGNQLAGDPDFGAPKICTLIYSCGAGAPRVARIQESRDLRLSCP